MATIIDQIINIDSVAQKKLDEAEKLKLQYRRETEEKMAETDALIQKKADEKLARVQEEEERAASEEKKRVEARTAETIARLEKVYEEKHEALERELFENVTGTSL